MTDSPDPHNDTDARDTPSLWSRPEAPLRVFALPALILTGTIVGLALFGRGLDLQAEPAVERPGLRWFNPFGQRAALAEETRQLRREVQALTREVLEARGDLLALQQDLVAVLNDYETDWSALAQDVGQLTGDCPRAVPLPAAPQREAAIAYRTSAAVLHHQHPMFNVTDSWPMVVELPDGAILHLRVLPQALPRLPDWQAGRTAELCFGWLDDVRQPVLLGDFQTGTHP